MPILDSFDWAFQAPANSLEEFRGGVDLIRKQLHETLGKLGLKPIAAKGQPFDPHMHEAIEVVEDANLPDNQIVEELQRGMHVRFVGIPRRRDAVEGDMGPDLGVVPK